MTPPRRLASALTVSALALAACTSERATAPDATVPAATDAATVLDAPDVAPTPDVALTPDVLAPPDARVVPDAGPRVRVVIMTDTHVIGPQYTTPRENSPADNASILLTPQRLRAARDRINAIRPAPAAVIVLGDVTHAAHHSQDVEWYSQNRNAFTVAKEIFDTFAMPVHVLMGNHDYGVGCDGVDTYPRSLSEELFRRFFHAEPYYTVQYGGVNFYLLNGQQGRAWDMTSPMCNTDLGSYGRDQLRWLDSHLADNVPSVVMSHYMGLLWDHGEVPDEPAHSDLATTLASHHNVKMYLAGHTHRWLDFSRLYPYPHYVVGPGRYDDNDFWLLELDGASGTVTIVDRDKAVWGNTCAHPYSYTPSPMLVSQDLDPDGTCVMGTE